MSNLPAKPEFSRTARAWPEPGDDRRPSGPGRASPDRYSHQRDDRDRDRDRERGSRSRYTPSGQRSPLPPRSVDTYISSARDTYHGREYRGYDDARARDDRRKDWDRERDRDRDRDRDRGYYRRDNAWAPRNEYSPNRPTSSGRGYSSRESNWRGRDDYRRERDRERGRSRDRDDQRPRDREHDRRPASPTYRPAPLSPRREPQSLPRRVQPLYPTRGRRSTSPQSTGSRSRRSSLLSRVRPELVDTHPPREIPRGPRSPSSRRGGPSPSRHAHSVSSPTRSVPERRSAETAGCQLYDLDMPHREVVGSGSEPIRGEDEPVEDAVVLDGRTEAELTTETLTKGKDRSDEEPPGKAESPGSPSECQQQLIATLETDAIQSSEVVVTQPYLPDIPRYEAKARFSAAYEGEYNRIEVHRAHAAAECRRCSKASRRAFHELEMTTLDLRAAQHRRELAEAHRKKAHHGQLGIDAETVQ